MLTIVAFIFALAVLVTIHELGHYGVARACGVRVLRFSVGFGRPLMRWTPKGSDTEFVIAALPLGGYVKMLDEREAPVAAADRHLAFNTQRLRSRVAIVAAGPIANLLLASFLYAVVNWVGVEQPRAILASPNAGSVAEQAGFKGGEIVVRAGLEGAGVDAIASFEDLRWMLTRGALEGRDVTLVYNKSVGSAEFEAVLKMGAVAGDEPDAQLYRKIGIVGPWTAPVIGEVMTGGAASRSGLKSGDVVLRIGPMVIVDGQQLREVIRGTAASGLAVSSLWLLDRGGRQIEVEVTPDIKQEGGLPIGRISAYVGAPPALVTVGYGFFEGLSGGVVRTWEVSILTLRMMGRMVIGEASLKNLSGPLTVADYAGKSANLGLTQFLIFLALISVSLGVLNLLPLPMLDGGHLMYYLWEGVTGNTVSDVWLERLQRGGFAILLLMMSIALFNDISRLLG